MMALVALSSGTVSGAFLLPSSLPVALSFTPSLTFPPPFFYISLSSLLPPHIHLSSAVHIPILSALFVVPFFPSRGQV